MTDEHREEAFVAALSSGQWDQARSLARELSAIERACRQGEPYRGRAQLDEREAENRVLSAITALERGKGRDAYFAVTDGVDPTEEDLTDLEAAMLMAIGARLMHEGDRVLAAMAVGGDVADEVCLDLRIDVYELPFRASEIAIEHYRTVGALHTMAHHLVRVGRYDEAVDAAKKAIDAEPSSLLPYLIIADAHEVHEQLDEAVDILERATDNCPDASEPWARLGQLFETDDIERALKAFERALELDESDVVANEGRRRVLAGLGDDEALVDHLEAMLERGTGSPDEVRSALIAARERVGDLDGADAARKRFEDQDAEADRERREEIERGIELAGPPEQSVWAYVVVGLGVILAALWVMTQ